MQQPVADRVERDRREVERRQRLRGERDLHHATGRRDDRIQRRGRGPARQRRRRGRQSLLHELAGLEDVGAVREVEEDGRQLGDRFGADLIDAGDALERVLERDRDQLLDLGGREAQALRLDLDADRCELREHIDLLVAERPHSEQHQRRRGRHHQVAVAQARADEEAHGSGADPQHGAAGMSGRALRHQVCSRTPVWTPYSSSAPTVTTRAPTAGPRSRYTESPEIWATDTGTSAKVRADRPTNT